MHLRDELSHTIPHLIICSKKITYGVKQTTQPFPKRQILDYSKLKEFADDNFTFDKNGKKVLETGRKRRGKRRNCSLRAISPFPTVFSIDLYCRPVGKKTEFVWERVNHGTEWFF